MRFALAPTGEVTRIHDWDDPNWYVTYKELPKNDAWIFVARPELAVIQKLAKNCKRLDDPAVTRNIFVGIQTSADHIYHLERAGRNRYRFQPPKPEGSKTKPAKEEVSIEDAIMHPIVSGQEVQRYRTPITNTFILFPYLVDESGARLMSAATLKRDYPLAWAYLRRFETQLRARESDKMNVDDGWWGYNYPKNLDKQDIAKILVPRLCVDLAAVNDRQGEFFIDNVDVGGIQLADGVDPDFIVGILNSAPVNFVWRRIAKPFQNGYFSANKQFIAPLPIPGAALADITGVSTLSERLTELHTSRGNILSDLKRRFEACDVVEKPEEWLWPSEVRSIKTLQTKAPKDLSPREKVLWAKEERSKQVNTAIERLQDRLRIGAVLDIGLDKGELSLKDEGTTVLDKVFVDSDEAEQILIDWRNFFRGNRITEAVSAASLSDRLRRIRRTDNAAIAEQIAELDAQLSQLDREILASETALNDAVYVLFGLSSSEIRMVENN